MPKIEDVILFQIDLTNKMARQYSQKDFDRLKLGISIEQWVILKIIEESVSLTQKELAKKSYRDPASITRTLDLLEKKHLIVRQDIANNRRTYNLLLTNEGKKFVDTNLKIIQGHRANSVKGLTKDELEQLSSILKKMRENMV